MSMQHPSEVSTSSSSSSSVVESVRHTRQRAITGLLPAASIQLSAFNAGVAVSVHLLKPDVAVGRMQGLLRTVRQLDW